MSDHHPNDAGPSSFAQTSAEFALSDSDDDDLRSMVGGEEAYELHGVDGRPARWDATKDETQALRRASDGTSVASFELYTPDEDLAVRRKFDRKLVLFVALLFLLSFLDRSSTAPFPFVHKPSN